MDVVRDGETNLESSGTPDNDIYLSNEIGIF